MPRRSIRSRNSEEGEDHEETTQRISETTQRIRDSEWLERMGRNAPEEWEGIDDLKDRGLNDLDKSKLRLALK